MLPAGYPDLLARPSLRLAPVPSRVEEFGRLTLHSRYFPAGLAQLEGRGGVRENNRSELAKLLRENKRNIIIGTTGTRASFGAGLQHDLAPARRGLELTIRPEARVLSYRQVRLHPINSTIN